MPPTTVAPTTQPTTVAEKEISSVVGYDYESAKNKLEEQGFKVAEGNHLYSTLYSEGYVISQSPESGTKAKPGTVITLDISLGEEYVEPETTAPEESSQSSATENDFIFANSDDRYIVPAAFRTHLSFNHEIRPQTLLFFQKTEDPGSQPLFAERVRESGSDRQFCAGCYKRSIYTRGPSEIRQRLQHGAKPHVVP